MRLIARLIAALCLLATLGVSVMLWDATGRALFTQLPSEELARMQAAKPAEDQFAGLGMNDLAGAPAKVDNSFRFGLLPAGPGHRFADSASVLTTGGPALLLFLLSW